MATRNSPIPGPSGYVLVPLRESAEFTLYRGRKHDDPSPVLAIALSTEQPSPQSIRRLEHEYSFAAELDPAWAAKPLAITRHEGRTILILKDPGGQPLDRILERDQGQPLDLTRFLSTAIGLARTLGQVHQHGLIHKDIKPANVLVDDTGNAWLTGFGIASQLPRERQSPEPPEFIAGTLAYMAPEQTGRMNRSIDSRSDLYSLGVTFYEMLTGSLPFTASDPMEWVHCHIARQPAAPSERLGTVPASVSAITMKLLSKTAEERYQTAAGVESDLRRCLSQWESQGCIDDFTPGAQDTPDRLMIPEKLYGRDREVDTLLTAFDRIVARRPSRNWCWSPDTPASANPQSSMNSTSHSSRHAACLRQASSTSTSVTFRMPRWRRHFRASSGRSSARARKNYANGVTHFARRWSQTDC